MNKLGSVVDDETIKKLNSLKTDLENNPEPVSVATPEKGKNILKKKADGAVAEIARRTALDTTVEDDLSKGLEYNPGFVKKFKIIDKKRIWVYEKVKNIIKKIQKDDTPENSSTEAPAPEATTPEAPAYVFDEEAKLAMIELEKELTDPFAKSIYDKLADQNRQLLLEYLVDNSISQDESAIIDLKKVVGSNYNVVYFSDNGYLMQLANKEEVFKDQSFQLGDPKALYTIISPDGQIAFENLDYESAVNKLEDQATSYQKKLKDEFLKNTLTETDYKASAEIVVEPEQGIALNNDLVKMTDEEYVELYKKSHRLNKGIESGDKAIETSDTEAEVVEETKPEIIINEEDKATDVLDGETSESVVEPPVEPPVGSEPEVTYNFDNQVLNYADKMGIKAKELGQNEEFISLNPTQQKFVLEVLNRSSLAKIKVEAHNNFAAESQSKKWYNVGFAFNQNFHKKKHEVLAAKEIHAKGLEGYGETEFSWLTSVIKNGPEINIQDDGEVTVEYLHPEEDDNEEMRRLIAQYNEVAYKAVNDKTGHAFSKELSDARSALIKTAESVGEVVNKLVEAEKQIKMHRHLKGDPESEKIIKKLTDNSLGVWDETKMLIGGQKDKAGYMGIGMASRLLLRSETAAILLGKGLTYAVGPAVAFVIGGYRANVRASRNLDEKAELALLGIKDESEMAQNLNLAAGSPESKILGLSEKLDRLVDKFNSLNAQAETDQSAQEDLEKVSHQLKERIYFTGYKMENNLVSYGDPKEQAANYYKLLNSFETAKVLLFTELSVLNFHNKSMATDKEVTDLTRTNKKIKDINDNKEFNDLKKLLSSNELSLEDREKLELQKKTMVREWYMLNDLSSLSVSDRLASFLNYNEEKRQSAEFKYLMTETGKGAIMGATFAAVGAWIFEHTGLGNWTSEQVSKASHLLHVDQAVDWTVKTTKDLFSGNDHSSSGAQINNIIEQPDVEPVEVKTPAIETPKITEVPKVEPVEVKTPITEVPKVAEVPKITEVPKVTPVVETPKVTIIKAETYSAEIKSEPGQDNSVWKSLRHIFKSNPEALGYKGDLNDTHELNRWSETQTANAIHNSGGVDDKVYQGNRVVLERDGADFKVAVEQGEGFKPGQLEQLEHNIDRAPEIKPVEIKPLGNLEIKPVGLGEPRAALNILENNRMAAVASEVSKAFHIKPEALEVSGKNLIYKSGSGRIIFDSATKNIKEVFNLSNKSIPQEFVNELKGRTPIDKFVHRGGLEKIFSGWNKLSLTDKGVYESLKLEPVAWLKKINELFGVKTDAVFVGDKSFVETNSGRQFDRSFDGVKNLVRFLSHK